jgi:hypothetical protein
VAAPVSGGGIATFGGIDGADNNFRAAAGNPTGAYGIEDTITEEGIVP